LTPWTNFLNGEIIIVAGIIGVGRAKGKAENEHNVPSKHSILFNAIQPSLIHFRPFGLPIGFFLECSGGH